MKNKCKLSGTAVVITVMMFNALLITGCNNDPSPDDPHYGPPEDRLEYDTMYLYSSSWSNEDNSGESYGSSNQIKLSDFTAVKPQQGDVLQFKISGKSNKKLKNFNIGLFQMQGNDWSTYKWLGAASSYVDIADSFTGYLTDKVTVENAPNPNAAIYVMLANVLWTKDTSSGKYVIDSGERLPAKTPDGTLMATITNFSISLVMNNNDDEGDGSGDGGIPIMPGHEHKWGEWTITTPATFIAAGVETETCAHDSSHTNGTRVIAQRIITTAGDWAAACTQLNGKTGGYTLFCNHCYHTTVSLSG